jgi:hypothetical protein
MNPEDVLLKYRPHHLFCLRFIEFEYLDRGEDFLRVGLKIREIMTGDTTTTTTIEVAKGVDELCSFCPDLKDNRCSSPFGDEVEVRKWDAIILNNIGVLYGDKMTVRELRSIIEQKAPLPFCRTRCSWKERCSVFDLDKIRK